MRASAPLTRTEVEALGGAGTFMAAPGPGMPYWRIHEGRLLFGGVDVRGLTPGDDADRLARGHRGVDRLLRRRLPGHRAPAVQRWGGPLHVTPAETPYIARSAVSDRIVYAVGFAGSGVALTLTCGPLVRDLVLGPEVADPAAVLLRDGIRATRIPWRDVLGFLLDRRRVRC
jgi:glycine/D-amino acid oxidase-like deaminating enzyme